MKFALSEREDTTAMKSLSRFHDAVLMAMRIPEFSIRVNRGSKKPSIRGRDSLRKDEVKCDCINVASENGLYGKGEKLQDGITNFVGC